MDWYNEYRGKLAGAGEAVRHIPNDSRVFIHHACSYPQVLEEALVRTKGSTGMWRSTRCSP